MTTRDTMIRELEARRRSNVFGLLTVYGAIVGTLVVTAVSMT